MALQWLVLSYVVAAEAAVAILVTLPTPKLLRDRLVYFVSLILQPALFIVPFAGFQLVDIYWKNEHRLMCTSDVCTAAERDRYEKSSSLLVPYIACSWKVGSLLMGRFRKQLSIYTKLREMWYCALQLVFSIGLSTAYASTKRTSRIWRKWRRGTSPSSFFLQLHIVICLLLGGGSYSL
ncbi:uncharacterized protein LOC130983282 isoform X1 [Arachis stenosperma]|uniref:uncharacterized protein LOC130983282 isoform X1 n=1 Tax=Arachis stenosperma TaxID=217475 RepID=UPI0025AC0C1A|nr:uncharacterized protein LOC130983282 isoform X1 [Arachis stenosperma]